MARSSIPVNRIASELNISAATISRVINHPELVNSETRYKVEQSLLQHGIDLDSLRNRQQNDSKRVIMVVIPSIDNPFYHSVLKGIEASALSHNLNVILYQATVTKENKDRFLKVASMTNTRGVICLSRMMEADLADDILSQIPLVQCTEYNAKAQAPYVSINNFTAAKTATEYIISMGYRKIAMINGPLSYIYGKERLRGFESALSEADIQIPWSWKISLPDVAFNFGFSAACQLLGNENRPDAIFCAADVFAISTIKAAKRYGLRVPEDLGIVGFDNIDMASIAEPGITTINQPSFQMGFAASEALFEQIYSPTSNFRSILLDTELIARDSIIQKRLQ